MGLNIVHFHEYVQEIKDGFIEIFLQKHCTDSQKNLHHDKDWEFVWKRVIEGRDEKERTLKQIDWIHLEPLNILMDH